jgi:hypothetical protein
MMQINDRRVRPLGFETLTVTNTAKSLQSIPQLQSSAEVKYCLFSADTSAARWRDDGTAPTSSVGMLLPLNIIPCWYAGEIHQLQFIATTGTSNIHVLYYG